jgi:hypothetical protein
MVFSSRSVVTFSSRSRAPTSNDLAVGCRLPASQHQIVDRETLVQATILAPLKPALVFASKRLTSYKVVVEGDDIKVEV